MNVLHVDSSILGAHSVSRAVSAAVVSRLRETHRDANVVYRDVAAAPLPQLTGSLAATLGKSADQVPSEVAREAAALRQALGEVLAADVIVVGVPMYNFGIPSQLKTWLDALAVAGVTFRYSSAGPEGLLGSKRLVIASSQGGFYRPGTPAVAFEHQESHLRAFFAFLGLTNVQVVRADGTKVSGGDEHGLPTALREAAALQVA
ncbi:FMN-dependent NADH-azoreductase 1 [Gemmata obscuriglobus]|uniref:FMN dependent NADH:quinone oxidoreductase n=1 Tax=Gemmata obscuriglobus TaxID=114 RepID=A0A2Z3GVV5_9BACT|nr:NAD(P)H-dependent oxidoreductase [Gemmata obscuriglobus]AWM36681.1 FMN-dependent NADH-azoreductase [Gemmata obscuriglobus]QEG30677.1 FMN-dependent NADH-azoreductase 1 [Gemmata obscuriglobus]VTS10004.1 fmn-dependent nadh-azoreductase : FMN-dependent NADH-azoreductase OS=Singulisphaera acidiphila (strain ATCC BAA-1392 / DSM 18658 / VKM B-2454 / MOB10) GN=azoR PE=3 SV=1: Flavodoxin_2 [Gemmata obscuriglobus UQM 2246]